MAIKNLNDVFVKYLKEMYSCEKQLVTALPKMEKAAANDDLARGIQKHLEATKKHVTRLEEVFHELGMTPRGTRTEGVSGLLEDAEQTMQSISEPHVMDAALICAAQRVEHYEIASYGCLRTFADELGYSSCTKLLQQTLDEEEAADRFLTEIAVKHINQEALVV